MGRSHRGEPNSFNGAKVELIRNVLLVGSGGLLAQALTIGFTPILTRLYPPHSFGIWALLVAIGLSMGAVVTLRYELAVPLPDTDDKAAQLVSVSIVSTILLTCVTAVALLLGGPWLGRVLGLSELGAWLWVLPPFILSRGMHQTSIGWFTRIGRFGYLTATRVLLVALTVFLQIGLFLIYPSDAKGLIAGSVLGQLLAGVVAGVLVISSLPEAVSLRLGPHALLRAAREYIKYPLFMTPYTVMGELRNRAALFLFGSFGTEVQTGLYAFAERLVRVPVTFAAEAIRPVFFERAARTKLLGLERPLLRSLFALNGLVTPFFIALWVDASDLVGWIFGADWRDSAVYAVVLSVPFYVLLHTNWLDRGFDVLGRQRLVFAIESVFSVLSIGALVLGLIVFDSVLAGVVLQSLALLLYNVWWLIAFYHIAQFNITALSSILRQMAVFSVILVPVYMLFDSVLPLPLTVTLYLAVSAGLVVHSLKAEVAYLVRGVREREKANSLPPPP